MTDDVLKEKAFALFAEGESTTQVANKLFNKNYGKTKKLRDAYEAEQGGATEKAADPDAVEGEQAEPENWTLRIEVPPGRLDAMVASFTEAEKATAVQAVLQSRVDEPA